MYACLCGNSSQLSELAHRFSPLVEPIGVQAVLFTINGLTRLIGDEYQIASTISRQGEQLGIAANLAIAANPATATLAARHIPGVTIIPPGHEAEALAALPIEALPVTPELAVTFSRWGIRTVGDLAMLPEIGLTERLGLEGSRLHKLALGRDDSILAIRPLLPEYTIHQQMEDPVELLEPLLFVVSAQLHELVEKLQKNGHATNRISVDLKLETGTFHRELNFPTPLQNARVLLKQIQLALQADPPGAPIFAVQITFDPVTSRTRQNGLFVPTVPEPENLQTLLARLHILVGKNHVGSPEILDTYRPDAYRLRPCAFEPGPPRELLPAKLRLAFRYFRPPLKAHLTIRNYQFQHVASERVTGEIVKTAGPWRTSGNWWESHTVWHRDEWDIVLGDCAIYRIYCADQQWFLEGSYD